MKASAWKGGGNTYGVRVGIPNREKYFKPHWKTIEVLIDGKSHTFKLTPGFWKNCPEFRDSGSTVIRDWLEENHSLSWPKGKPPQIELLPLLTGRFRLVG